MATYYFIIPTPAEPLLASYANAWEQQSQGLKALVGGIYTPTQEPITQNILVSNRVSEYFSVFENNFKIHSTFGFFLVADENQITPEIWALMQANGVQKMNLEEFTQFKQSLT